MTVKFDVIVGRRYWPAAQAEAALRADLREKVRLWISQNTKLTPERCSQAADLAVADQLPERRRGVTVAMLTADQLRHYAQQVAP